LITENLSTLKIHKLTQEQYDREFEAGRIDPSAMYLTPADEETDPTVPAWAKEPAKPTYTASEVGADASGTASSLISTHNSDATAHIDIRAELAMMDDEHWLINDKITALSNNKLNASELPAAINTHNTASNAHSDIREQISQLSVDKADKSAMTLGVHTDGFVYLFINGAPQGNGLDIKADVVEGDVFGYVDENNVIVLNGALAEGTYSVKYEMEDGSTVDIGNLVLDNNVYYSITNNLTNCTNSNNTVQMVEGGSYSATITAKSGYELSSVKVTMGGTDISSTAVSGGNITIANVTGNIVITAVATEKAVTPTYTNLFVAGGDGYILNGRCSSTGADRNDSKGCLVSNYIKVSNGDTVYVNQEINTQYSGFKLSDGSTTGAVIPSDTTKIKDYSVTNGIAKFTINIENVEYVRVNIVLNNNNTAITETDVENAGIIITVNEEINNDTSVTPAYTNLADPTSSDWKVGRLGSDGGIRTDVSLAVATNFIPVTTGDVVRVSGCNIQSYHMAGYNTSKTKVFAEKPVTTNKAYYDATTLTTNYAELKIVADVAYVRFSCTNPSGTSVAVVSDDIIITKNEPIVSDTNVYYSVTNNLTQCTTNNSVTQAVQGEPYSATISAKSGYELSSVKVTMGGTDISASAVSGGKITISNVTGNIVITAVAEVKQAAEPVTQNITLRNGIRLGSDGGDRTGATGYCATERINLTNIPKPCTIHLTKAKWAFAKTSETGYIMTCAKNASGTNLVCSYTNDTIGSGYFTVVRNNSKNTDVTVTVTSAEVTEICFSGHWTNSEVTAEYPEAATTMLAEATLTYTPAS
jgi:hypothetical protein